MCVILFSLKQKRESRYSPCLQEMETKCISNNIDLLFMVEVLRPHLNTRTKDMVGIILPLRYTKIFPYTFSIVLLPLFLSDDFTSNRTIRISLASERFCQTIETTMMITDRLHDFVSGRRFRFCYN